MRSDRTAGVDHGRRHCCYTGFHRESGHLLGHLAEGEADVYKKFVWNDRLELKIAKMNQEHKILIEKINDLVDVLERHSQHADFPAARAAFKALASLTT